MFRALSSLFSAPHYQQESHHLYLRIVEASRAPQFYTDCGVAATLDGRFDMITLHMFLVIDRLKKDGSPQALEFIRALSEVFFSDMDRSLREMGSSDTGVGKRIKKMSQAFYGRLLAYQSACSDDAKMQEALLRNLYRSDVESLSHAMAMSAYVQNSRKKLTNSSFNDLLQGMLP